MSAINHISSKGSAAFSPFQQIIVQNEHEYYGNCYFLCFVHSDSQHFLYFHYDKFRLQTSSHVRPVEGHYLLHLHIIPAPVWNVPFCWKKKQQVSSVRSCCISPQLAGSVRRVCQWLEQPVTFSDCQHTRQPPVTSSALTWHVKTPLKAPRHPPAPAHLSLDAHEVHTRLLTYHTIKPLKAV